MQYVHHVNTVKQRHALRFYNDWQQLVINGVHPESAKNHIVNEIYDPVVRNKFLDLLEADNVKEQRSQIEKSKGKQWGYRL